MLFFAQQSTCPDLPEAAATCCLRSGFPPKQYLMAVTCCHKNLFKTGGVHLHNSTRLVEEEILDLYQTLTGT